jgi:endonuclease G
MSRIFISYRRSDSGDITGRIYDHLLDRFDKDELFKDVDSIRASSDYRDAVRKAIESCDVVLVIIGPTWASAADAQGNRRLENPADLVRVEAEAALKRSVPVIPVLVGGATMPAAESLPEDIRALTYRHALPVRSDPDFRNDVAQLVKTIRDILRGQSWVDIARNSRKAWAAAAALLSALLLAGSVMLLRRQGWLGTERPPVVDTVKTDEDATGEEQSESVAQEGEPEKVVPYDPQFLGVTVPLPSITDNRSAGDLLNGSVFDYTHYSLVMNEQRGMPLYTACNLDGSTLKGVRRERDNWRIDKRVPRDLQKGGGVYSGNEWDRGHIVQRLSVAWGDEADAHAAALSTFYYPNSVPQLDVFNQGIWASLENRILDEADAGDRKVSVFAGPLFRSDDWEYRGSKIPRSFWKIVAAGDPDNPQKLLVHAYVMDQYSLGADGSLQQPSRPNPSTPFDPKGYQVSVAAIEALTPLQFGPLRRFDTFTGR